MLKSLKKITLEEFLIEMDTLIKEKRETKPKAKLSKRKRNWIHLIENGMLVCPASEKLVAYCSYDKNMKANSFHYNFYAEDGEMFTIDHKIPKAKGGTGALDNVQAMIQRENTKKGTQETYL